MNMDIYQRSLELAHQAQALDQDILQALADGDSEKAEACCLDRQKLIEAIPFAEFRDPPPPALLAALHQLIQNNQELTVVTEKVQLEINQQLSAIKKGKAGSQAYRRISEHK